MTTLWIILGVIAVIGLIILLIKNELLGAFIEFLGELLYFWE